MTIFRKNRTHLLSLFLLLAGCIQMAGYISQSRLLTGLGLSYGMAPMPTVFSRVNGVEGFDTKHTLIITSKEGKTDSILLDQNLFARFRGAYSLKNSYSLFLAYSHMWKPEQVTGALHFLECKKNILYQFNIPESFDIVSIKTERTLNGKKETITLTTGCQ